MPLAAFLADLFEHGRVKVAAEAAREAVQSPSGEVVDDVAQEQAYLAALLEEAERIHRLEYAGPLPAFDVGAAAGAAAWFSEACRCLVERHLPAEAVEELLGQWSISDADAAAHYSVDLVLRYLPDLIRLSRGLAENDPLVGHLARVGAAWPLSLASLPGAAIDASRVEIVLAHPALRALYVDRALATGNIQRLADPRCRDEAMAALGACRELAGPAVAAALWPPAVSRTATEDMELK